MTKIISSFAALILLVAVGQSAEVKVSSPDQKAVITVTDSGGLSYKVSLDGREVVSQSRFGIVADGVDLGASVTLGKSSSRKMRESYAMFGGHSRADPATSVWSWAPPWSLFFPSWPRGSPGFSWVERHAAPRG